LSALDVFLLSSGRKVLGTAPAKNVLAVQALKSIKNKWPELLE
jgi:hypothetical protein